MRLCGAVPGYVRMTTAGTPAAKHKGGMSPVTTLPAPITLPRPIRTPGVTIVPVPSQTASSITTGLGTSLVFRRLSTLGKESSCPLASII